MSRLRISDIFFSLQGETRTVGYPTVFVRFTDCPSRVPDSPATPFENGKWMETEEIVAEVSSFKAHYVTITGGEPLAQKPCLELLQKLSDAGYEVALETCGTFDISGIDNRVVKILDIKTPGSGKVDKNLFANLDHLFPHDQIKFAICDRADYEWSKNLIKNYRLTDRCQVLFSPKNSNPSAIELADWIKADHLPARVHVH